MKKVLLGSFALAALSMCGTAGMAADIAYKAPAYKAPPPTWTWTGFYIGATAGGAWSTAGVSLNAVNGTPPLYFPVVIPALDVIGSPSISGSSAIFGARLGYNQQWGSLVWGLEGDISYFRVKLSAFTNGNPFTPILPPAVPNFATFSTNVSSSWLATVRPRVGFAAGPALFYGTGGVAIANVSFSNVYLGHSDLGAGNEFEATSASQTRVGWAAGAGVDYALAMHWILSVEYLHVDLGSIAASGLVTTGNANTATFNFSTKLQSDIVRGGVSYKF
jgi:outer membrane immunogenic protein